VLCLQLILFNWRKDRLLALPANTSWLLSSGASATEKDGFKTPTRGNHISGGNGEELTDASGAEQDEQGLEQRQRDELPHLVSIL
jgi:hypothetical protein